MNYEIGDKFIFEIDRIYSSKKHEESRYGIKGFENLVLSKRKLNELLTHKNIEKLDEHDRTVAEDAFQLGFDSKSEWFQNDAYRRGLDDAWHAICLIEHVWTVREVEELFGRGFEQIYDMDIETVIETVKKHEAQKAEDAIEDLENRLNLWRQDKIRRWIPATEQLPKENGFYLCLYKHKASGGVAMDEGLSILQWINNKWGINDIYLVTHWMPLPQPPESEGNR